MDLQKYVDGFGAMTCIVSVENLGNGNRGKFRIVTGNKAYIDSIEHPAPGAELLIQKYCVKYILSYVQSNIKHTSRKTLNSTSYLWGTIL